MLTQPLLNQLKELHCHGMIEALQEQMKKKKLNNYPLKIDLLC